MKKNIRNGIFGLLLIMASCDQFYYIYLVNDSNQSLYLASPELNCIILYPDTILPEDKPIDTYLEISTRLESSDTVAFYEAVAPTIDEIFCGSDTMSFYIFDADTVDMYSWDTIIKYNMVLQRYDLSWQDFEERNESWRWTGAWLYFPPTEAMKHIHMWPPYGTYDEHGRRKDKRN